LVPLAPPACHDDDGCDGFGDESGRALSTASHHGTGLLAVTAGWALAAWAAAQVGLAAAQIGGADAGEKAVASGRFGAMDSII
jgi:hypothetical protein